MTPTLAGAHTAISVQLLSALFVIWWFGGDADLHRWALPACAVAICQMLANVGGQIVKAIRGERT